MQPCAQVGAYNALDSGWSTVFKDLLHSIMCGKHFGSFNFLVQ